MRITSRAAWSALMFAGVTSFPLLATPITGIANITGEVTVAATAVDFGSPFGIPSVGAVETGSFAGLTGGSIQTLTGGPHTGSVSVPGFISFNQGVATPITFDLVSIAPGFGTLAGCAPGAALGAECTPTGSPFTIIQGPDNTLGVYLTLVGTAYTGTSGSGLSVTTGAFTTQTVLSGSSNPGSAAALLDILLSGGTVSASYSAQFAPVSSTPIIPEPASLILMGVGLLGAGIVARKKLRG